MSIEIAKADLETKVGTETHVGPWLTVTQEMINQFAAVTRDEQWIHVDPELAQAHSPYGTTIAHGYFTLSLTTFLTELVNPDKPGYPGVKLAVNYGLNKVRFPHPVKVDSRIRARTTLQSVEEVRGGLQLINTIYVEIEGEAKPGCVAESVSRLYF